MTASDVPGGTEGASGSGAPDVTTRARSFALRDLRLAPNVLSLLRVPLAAAFPLATREGLAPAGVVLALAGVTDVLDGWLARRSGQVTATGAIVDPIADKVFALSVVGTLLAEERLPPWAIPALLAREILEAPLVLWVLVTRARRREPLPATQANVPGKAATAVQFVAVLAALAAPRLLTFALGAAAVTGAVAGAAYWLREIRRARGANGAPGNSS